MDLIFSDPVSEAVLLRSDQGKFVCELLERVAATACDRTHNNKLIISASILSMLLLFMCMFL